VTTGHQPKFQHPVEEEFARILDYYQIPWEYEPKTFNLKWGQNGRVTEAFTPDFFLPDQDLYVELTTLRPQLATYKNRRIRKMKELYPDVNVKLFNRKMMRDLLTRFGLDGQASRIKGTGAQETTP
jgi:hypoxanthine phosphoribosyltransferase